MAHKLVEHDVAASVEVVVIQRNSAIFRHLLEGCTPYVVKLDVFPGIILERLADLPPRRTTSSFILIGLDIVV